MKIFRILPEFDVIQSINPSNETDWDFFNFEGLPKSDNWRLLEFYVVNPLRKRANFFIMGSGASMLVMDETASNKLAHFWSKAGELLPIKLETGETLYILNVVEVANALNIKMTLFDLYEDGTRGRILKPYFYSNRLPESSIFKIPETAKTVILTFSGVFGESDEFYSAYLKSGLTGLEFDLLDED